MDWSEHAIGAVVLVLITMATLWSSLEYHQLLASEYGNISHIFLPTIAITSFICGFLVSIFFQWGINVLQFEKVVKLLPTDERNILMILFNKRKITQAELFVEAGVSKSKISRIVSRLEDRGVITKKQLDNTNLIESRMYRAHPSTQLLTKLPGFSETRLLLVIFIVLIFGITLSVLNSLHILTLDKPFRPVMYLNAIELFTLGGLFSIILRRKISNIQFDRVVSILPADEREVLRIIYNKHYLTQKSIVEQTEIHQMKISRILQKFEERGIIKKKPYGYTNIIISQM